MGTLQEQFVRRATQSNMSVSAKALVVFLGIILVNQARSIEENEASSGAGEPQKFKGGDQFAAVRGLYFDERVIGMAKTVVCCIIPVARECRYFGPSRLDCELVRRVPPY